MIVMIVRCRSSLPLVRSILKAHLTLSGIHTRPFFLSSVSVFFFVYCNDLWRFGFGSIWMLLFLLLFRWQPWHISIICSRHYCFHHTYCYYSYSLFLSNPLLQISSFFTPCAPSNRNKTLFQRSVLFFKVWFKHRRKRKIWTEVGRST